MQTYDFVRLEEKMSKKYKNEIHKMTYLSSELDALYHLSSVKFGISDSVSIVLYTIFDAGGECLLSEIYKMSGISKQTINSAIRNLEADCLIHLRQMDGRSKMVSFTEEGRAFAENTVARLFAAETDAFESWSEQEVDLFLNLMEKYADSLKEQIEKL